ncbi:alpha/beta fold hydrolase [Candidatus Palauibacter sp.]|uniref:alpha/beta fold hydrolase n=1 Tax=Candidatus Palauibacter sp. TaxID=3101350 RepID=UPI003B019F05
MSPWPTAADRPDQETCLVRDIEITDGTVRVTILGEGRPVLFLHGISAHGRAWRSVAEAFVAEHPDWMCWLPDLLGRGASEASPGLSYTLDDEVRRIREVIRALAPHGGAPRLVAGHSQGAAVALALAGVEPAVHGLLLASPVAAGIRRPPVLGLLGSEPVRRAVGNMFAPLHGHIGHLVLRRAGGPAFRAPPALVEAYARPWADPARARTLMRILADWRPADLESRMPDRPLAAHVVTGARDPRIPVAAARRLAARLGCGITVAPEGGHVLTEQHPRLLARLLAGLAATVSAA